jgi:anthranilate synthase/indole-3-glycerol phosphate synthase/phosphoribosylanthranilate isomerase
MATWEGGDEGWVGVEHDGEEADREADDYEEEESGFSEVLADAILKRPESIKVRSKKARERDKVLEEEQPTEFTFPSLTDFGTGMKGYGERNVHGEPEPAVPNLELGEPEAQVEESMLDTEPRDDAQLPTVQS